MAANPRISPSERRRVLLVSGPLFQLRPAQVSHQIGAMAPHEFPKNEEIDPVGVNSGVGFDPPAEIWAPPRREAMAAREGPRQPQHSVSGGGPHRFRRCVVAGAGTN